MKPIFSLLFLSTLVLFSCRSSKKNSANYRSMKPLIINASDNSKTLYRESAPRQWNIVHTRVALSFDYQNKTAKGQEWVILQPYFYATDSLTLDAKNMKIESVTVGQNDKPLRFTNDSLQLRIILDKKYTRYEQLKLAIKYTAMPYAAASGGSAAITDDRGLYFINTDNKIAGKPMQIWTQGETESNSHWLPTIDKPNSRTTLQIELSVPSQYKTLSNGELISSMDNGSNRVDIWRMDKPIQVYAIMFAIGDFAVAKEKWRGKEVNYYVEPEFAPFAKTMFQNTPEMMELFSKVTGVDYPWNKYSQVVVRDYVSGAMENTSASLFGEFMNQNAREYADENHEDVVSHELFHQWFGDYVTAESWSNLTLNESFATYGEYIWRKYKYGIDYADELAHDDLQKYLNYSEYSDPQLVRFHYHDKEAMFDRVSYQKGGAILHYLHHIIGDSAFYQSMKIYLTKNALQSAEATQWRIAVEEAMGKDMNWFFDQWYLRAGHPILDIKYTKDDAAKKLKVEITQVQKEEVSWYNLPLDVLVINGSEKQYIQWHLTKKNETFFYDYKDGVAPIIVPDVTHVLPGTIKENKTTKEWLVQMNSCDDYTSQLLALQSVTIKEVQTNEDAKSIVSKALGNKIAALRVVGLQKLQNINSENTRAAWKKKIVEMATLDGNNKARAMAIQVLGVWKEKDQQALFEEKINDSSYLVASNALWALWRIDEEEGYSKSKLFLNQNNNTALDKMAWSIVAESAKTSDTTLFASVIENKNDKNNRKNISSNLYRFAINTKDKKAYDKMISFLKLEITKTENKNQRLSNANILSALNEELSGMAKKDKKNEMLLYKIAQIKNTAQSLNTSEKETDIIEVYDAILQ